MSDKRKKRRFYGNQFTNSTTTEISTEEFDEPLVHETSAKLEGSFNWRPYLRKTGFTAAPLSCFKHVALSNCWESIVLTVRVEVRSPDCKTCCTTTPCCYWLATVFKVCGYWGLLRYDGFDKYSPHYFNVPDKWVNLCTEPHIHPVGWCAENGKHLVPPKSIEPKIVNWKDFLMDMLPGGRTLPQDFTFRIEEHTHNSIKKGMKLEVVDKNLISVVRSAIVTQVVGGRLHINYAESEVEEDEGFWCHERSPLIHPVGWAQIIGHALKAKPEYARMSLKKTLYRTFESDDATWDMFLPVHNKISKLRFKPGMKLEAIDPLNLSTICVATVTEVLRNNYLMIGIDGMMAANGSDWFCYHASSPCVFPVGFCESNRITLTPPRGYKGEFKWSEYLKKSKSQAAPAGLFQRDVPDHGFQEGMYLEAVDLMEPRLICVAYVTKVVGRLLKVHFDGWEDDYDQWCDCESPDLFPLGWCDVLGYRLEPPRVDVTEDKKKKEKPPKLRRRKKKPWSKRLTSDESPEALPEKRKPGNWGGSRADVSQGSSVLLIDDSSSDSLPEKKSPKKVVTESTPKSQKKNVKLNKNSASKTLNAKATPPTPPSNKTSPSAKKKTAAKKLVQDESPIPVGRKKKTRQKKSVAIIEEDSSSSSEDL